MDKLFLVQLIMAGLFLLSLFMAMSARIEVVRLRTRMTMLEDRVRQALAILESSSSGPDAQAGERSG